MRVRIGVASGLRLWFRSSFETIGVTLREDFVSVRWICVSFLLEFALGHMVRSGVMESSEVGVGGTWGRQSEGSERWCPRAAIQTAMPPAAAMVTWFSVLRATLPKTSQAFSRTAALSICVFMTASMTCWGKGGVG